ncbi:ABC transporter permease [Psychrobacillus sp. OK032]|uniref:ABC transporter permease n=1 Tax=Psychrobacillus sp. OK032 TaxID=1884358 RepID=UPI0008D607D2|nr:ABC transporter permease [Psychrobacillus sp. OK032]SES45310.1 ABC-2 type transport system permease protein [Psychrobacillus sp. OK032]
MRMLTFAQRNRKEILRDPITLLFGILLPIIIMWLFSIMQKNMPIDLYSIENLTPGVVVFSFSFITLFSGMLLGKDKSTSFLTRIFASPMTATDFIVGYTLPLLPVAILQIVICFISAFVLDLPFNISVIISFIVLIIISFLYIGFGILLGTLLTDKQVGGAFAIFVNLSAWLSGTWFELDMIGGTFKTFSYLLPFAHARDATRATLAGEYGDLVVPLLWVIGYTIVIYFIAISGFKKKMKG